MGRMHGTRYFALFFGMTYVVIGIVGFIPGFHTMAPAGAPHMDQTASYGYLFGLFPVNALHNVFHIVVGLAGMAVYPRFSLARAYCIVVFLLFGLLTFMGFMPQLDTTWGWIPLFSGDAWLHAATSIAAGFFAFVVPEPTTTEPAAAAH
jgi:hypothetical protein